MVTLQESSKESLGDLGFQHKLSSFQNNPEGCGVQYLKKKKREPCTGQVMWPQNIMKCNEIYINDY
jgi:hypothetical protein